MDDLDIIKSKVMCVLKEMERAQKKNVLIQQLLEESKRKEQEKHEQVTEFMIDLEIQGEEALKTKEQEIMNLKTKNDNLREDVETHKSN